MTTSEHTPQHASPTPEERPTSTVQQRSYTEHRILRGASAICARSYAGTGPAFVLMHGFPDNLHIYDRLIPYLRDRQVATSTFWAGELLINRWTTPIPPNSKRGICKQYLTP